MILKTFTRLVLADAVIAIPFGYLKMQSWLEDFAYQISLNNPLIWILPALFVAFIPWLTVGIQSTKSALENPIKALRSE
jgi:putative ABC transport system permease protein